MKNNNIIINQDIKSLNKRIDKLEKIFEELISKDITINFIEKQYNITEIANKSKSGEIIVAIIIGLIFALTRISF